MSPTKRLILGLLSERPRTMLELVKAVGLTRGCVTVSVRELKRKGLLKVVGKRQTDGLPAPVYATHVHYPMPAKGEPMRKSRKESPTYVAIFKTLTEHGPLTVDDLADLSEVPKSSVQSALSYYRNGGKTSKVFRIASWVRVHGCRRGWVPVYGKGPSADVPKPPADTKNNQAEWRERNRARIRARASLSRAKARGDEQPIATNPFFQLFQVTGSVYAAVQHEAREAA